jgi:beta-glucanase (GH16 family)
LNQPEYNIDFTQGGVGADKNWKNTAKAVTFGANGAEFNLKAMGDSVTYQTDFYIFFGYVEVKMRSAPGAGIVSSFVLQSDDLDEIDWEMIGSETDKVQSNYFGKGNTTVRILFFLHESYDANHIPDL